jgi:uncharacterized protein (TIGR02145 family)
MSKQYSLILIISLVFISSCEKECVKNSPWLNEGLKYKCVKDKEGNSYATIKIGEQTWMAENLRTSVYSNGDPIPTNVTENYQWETLTTGAWAHYFNDSKYETPYGKLYNWYAVADPRNVCPTGWHVPSDAEWNTLVGFLDPSFNPNATGSLESGMQSEIAGGKLKSTGTNYWQSPNTDANNESGFSGLPGGFRPHGPFYDLGYDGGWWSSTENTMNYGPSVFNLAWYRWVYKESADLCRASAGKATGLSVRCIKD